MRTEIVFTEEKIKHRA